MVPTDQVAGLLLRARDLGFPPTSRAPAVAMLDEEMGSSDLALRRRKPGWCNALGAVVGCHVILQCFRVCSRRWLPSGVFCLSMEVVR